MKRILLASSSTIYGSGYLAYLASALKVHFKGLKTLLFIPYARPSGISYEAYTEIVVKGFSFMNIKVQGIHEFDNVVAAIQNAEAIYVGGGNTFVLVDTLYRLKLMPLLQQQILKGTPYLGTSAGSNICGISMKTTNDMPIVMPPSFETLGVVPFNINAHYQIPNPNSTHKGETRVTRIKEFHQFNTTSVIGLQEGSWIEVLGDKIQLKGALEAFLFEPGKPVQTLVPAAVL